MRRSRHRQRGRERGRVEILEVEDFDRIARSLVLSRRDGEIDRRHAARGDHDERIVASSAVNGRFRAAIGHGVGAGAGVDRVQAAAAVDGVVARTRDERIHAGPADDAERCRELRSVEVLEIVNVGRVAGCLIRSGRHGEIDRRSAAGGEHLQRVHADAAVEQDRAAAVDNHVVARAAEKRVRAAVAVQRVRARAADDAVGARRTRQGDAGRQMGGVDVLEIGDDRRAGDRLRERVGEIDSHRRTQDYRVDAGSAVD